MYLSFLPIFVLDVVEHLADMDVSDVNKWSLGDVHEWLKSERMDFVCDIVKG